jgi:hypothetical protein
MKRRLLIAAAAVLILRLLILFIWPAWNAVSTDFPNYYTASWLLVHGEDVRALYDPVEFQDAAARAGIHGIAVSSNYFPPLASAVMVPVVAFSPLTALRVCIFVNLLALAVLVHLVSKHSGLDLLQTALIALLAGDALGNNFLFGQIYIPLTVLLILGFVWADSKPNLSGFMLALATAIKVFPGVFLLYLICRRRWKALAWSGLWLAVLAGISVSAVGWEAHRIYLVEVLPRMMRGEIQDPYNIGWNTLQALLRRSLVPEPGWNPHPLVEAPAVFFFLKGAINLVVLLLSALAIRDDRMKPLLAYLVLFLAVSLISPSQASYHYVLLIPGVAMLASEPRKQVRAGAVICLALICSTALGIAGRLDSGWLSLLAFPRAYLVLGLWLCLMWRLQPRVPWPAIAAIAVFSAFGSYSEMKRWHADEVDGAVMAAPEQHGYVEVLPLFSSTGVEFKSLVASGWAARSIARRGESASEELPERRWMVYSTFERGNWDVGIRDLRTGETRILTSSLANDVMPVVSPDGKEVYFASDRRRGYRFTAIYRMPVH